MAVRILFDHNHIPQEPTLVLANRNGNKLGVIPALHINVGDHLNDAMELQFVVQREYDGEVNPLWDEIVDFKLAWCPEWDAWFELHIESKDSDSVFKNINAIELGHAELSQINLYNIEINTETDIANDDYVVTVLYDEDNPKASLLNRIMEKVPHYSIGHVDSSIAGIQRTFSFDGTTILDALNDIGEELGCIFIIDSGSGDDGAPARTINAYDLESVCRECGYRGVFTGSCPECDSEDIDYGYGNDTNIYVSTENLSDDITYTSNVDEVKNCFRLVGGDDLMTAAIASCNPNGSGYMWYFSDAMKEDMSDELRDKLTEYNTTVDHYMNSANFPFVMTLYSKYLSLVTKYRAYKESLPVIAVSIRGYSKLMNAYYDIIDFEMFLRHELMPSIEISGKTAQTEIAKLTSAALSPTAVTDLEICSLATASSAVLSVAKDLVDDNYQVKVSGTSFDKPLWSGTFTVTNYSDDEDKATSSTITIEITDDQETYLKQRLNKTLSDATSDYVDIVDLFKTDLASFKNELKKYCLSQLNSMRDTCQACMDILIEHGVANGDNWEDAETNLYEQLYLPYYDKLSALIEEVAVRERELNILTGVVDENGGVVTQGMKTAILDHISRVQDSLEFEAFLGEELTKQLATYRRDDTYQNDNFISDGLNNAELISRAQEFIELAKKEIYKSATLQHSISSSLKNLLVMKEFSDLTEQFAVGNWLTVGVAGKPYRLRLTSYEIDFDDLENINVEFSDVVETGYGASDLESVLKGAASMSTSFGSVKRQAKRGGYANKTLSEYMEQGLALTNMKIISSAQNQNITMDEHGLLCRELVPYNEQYDERQLKIINRGLYLTKDNWRTSVAGIGDFIYYDPEDGTLKQDYGVIADVLMGNYILGEKFGIYNENGTVKIDKNGLTIISAPESEEGAGDNTVFKIQRATEGGVPRDVIWFDNTGNAHFSGSLEVGSSIGNMTVDELIDEVEGAIKKVDVEYCQNQSRTVPPAEDDAGWQTTAPAWQQGYYIWQRTATTGKDGVTYSDPVCISGRDGASSTISSIQYASGTSGTTAPSTGWQSTVPPVAQGNWLWVKTTYSDGTYSTTCSYIGTDGEDGQSVAIQSVVKRDGVTTVTLTDSDGSTKTLTINDGEDGDNGTPGANGYVHIAWANSADGRTDFSTSVSTNKEYIGAYTDNTEADSTNPSDYSWSLIKGEDGTSVSVLNIQYASGTSGTTAPSSGWQSTVPNVAQGRWLWVKTTYTDGSIATTCSYIGTDGEDGSSVSIQSVSKSGKTTTVRLIDSDGTTKTLTINDGEDGENGIPGAAGYIHVAWANSANGQTDFSTTVSTGKKYIGVYTDNIAADSTSPSSYSWSLIKGDDGISPNTIREQYYLSTSRTTLAGGSWSYDQPSWTSGKYIWTRSEITWSDSTQETPHITYTSPQLATALTDVCESVDGANKQEQLIYKSQAVGESAPGKNYTWVTNNGGAQNTWTLKRPVYDRNYPVLYVATQSKTVGGTIDCTQPMIDDTTTVIDGGKIITGSVTANQLSAGSVTTEKIEAGSVSADKIMVQDGTNYCQLNQYTAPMYDWTYDDPWYTRNTIYRDNQPSVWFDCMGGESFRVSMTISSTVRGAKTSGSSTIEWLPINIGVWAEKPDGTRTYPVYTIGVSDQAGTEQSGSGVVTIPEGYTKFRAFIQVGGFPPFSGQLKVRNCVITKMANASLIVDGSISADKISANGITADVIKGGTLTLGGSTTNKHGKMELKNSIDRTIGTFDYNGIWIRPYNITDYGFQVGPYGDIALGPRLSSDPTATSNLSSFYNNKCAFQVNNQGMMKGSEIQLWYQPSITSNFDYTGVLKTVANSYITLEKRITSEFNEAIVLSNLDGSTDNYGIKFYTDKNNPGNFSHINDTGLHLQYPLEIQSGGTGSSTAFGACTNIGAVNKTGDTMTGNLWIRPSSSRAYLGVIASNDYEADLVFGRNGSATWSISNRNSASANLSLYNNTRGEFVMRIDDADNHFKLYCPVSIEKSEGLTVVNPGSPWPRVTLGDNNNRERGQIIYDCPIVIGGNGNLTNSKFMFREFSMNTSGTKLSYYEDYHLPNCDQNKSSNSTYQILTTKNTLTVGQGGTGATTKAAARTNLDVYSKTEVDQKIADAGSGGSSITLPISVSDGGTGRTTLTSGRVLVGNGTSNVSLRQITDNTSATGVTASTNLITANTLYYHTGNSNISTVGTITSGTWHGTAIAASYIGNHSTDKLTSGTLGTSRGGTGITSNPSMLTNLGSTTAASVFATSPRPGVTGTLGTGNGGTGITSNPSMLTNLGSTTAANVFATSPRPGVTGTLGTGNGGTGATSASGARTNLDVYSTSEVDSICNNKINGIRVTTVGTHRVKCNGWYSPIFVFGINASKRCAFILQPGAGTPTIDKVFEQSSGALPTVSGYSKDTITITLTNGVDLMFVGNVESVTKV